MLPAKTSFQLTSSRTNPTKILALRIPEDLASKLVALASTAESARIVLDPSNPSGNVHFVLILSHLLDPYLEIVVGF